MDEDPETILITLKILLILGPRKNGFQNHEPMKIQIFIILNSLMTEVPVI